MHNGQYEIRLENDMLIFKTSSFRAEKTSVLHSGVYTKEFTSMLSASAAVIFLYVTAQSIIAELRFIHHLLMVIAFAAVFLVSRKFIFRDKYLEVDFDRKNRIIHIIQCGVLGSRTEKIPFEKIRSVEIGNRKFIPENIDGIDFVQKISAQHGSAVPGLSETEEFITLSLLLTDGSERIIYAAKINGNKVNGEPEVPLNTIKNFLKEGSNT
jgi:hypothetical protein